VRSRWGTLAFPEPKRLYGRCRTCNGLVVYLDVDRHLYFYANGNLHPDSHRVDFMEDPSARDQVRGIEPANQSPEPMKQGRVIQRVTDVGCYYRVGAVESGLCTMQDEQDVEFDLTIAQKLGVDVKEIMAAREWEVRRLTTFDEIADVLGCTIRHDRANKLILLCAGLLTFTDEDQINILMSGESAGGKSYTALEVASYFPRDIVRIIATASPTAFFHDEGEWDKETRILRVSVRQKLLIFLDQPHYTLMEKLRPLLSHDRRELLYKITDKSKCGSLRTKNVILEGYPTVLFCAAKLSLDEQERTRVFILSPQTDQGKLEESIRLRITRDGDRQAFRDWIALHPRRRWLRARIEAVRNTGIDQIVVEEQDSVYSKFMETHKRLAPRHQRDIGRILALIKAHALLNWSHREQPRPRTIIANRDDVEAGFLLYSEVAKSNELGLAPQIYEIYESVIKPHLDPLQPLRKDIIAASYFEQYGRPLPWLKLDREILPALGASGLIRLEPDPTDRRRMVVCPPHQVNISPQPAAQTILTESGVHPPYLHLQEGLKQA